MEAAVLPSPGYGGDSSLITLADQQSFGDFSMKFRIPANHARLCYILLYTSTHHNTFWFANWLVDCNAQGSPPPSPRIPAIEFKNEIGSGTISS